MNHRIRNWNSNFFFTDMQFPLDRYHDQYCYHDQITDIKRYIIMLSTMTLIIIKMIMMIMIVIKTIIILETFLVYWQV